jgi:type II secretion system (T2SS) protein G
MRLVLHFRSALFCLLLLSFVETRADLSPKQARKLITRMAGFDLPSSAVRVKAVSASSDSSAEASAEIQTAFRLTKNVQGHWRVLEVKTGPNQWEAIELIASLQKMDSGCDASDVRTRSLATEPRVKRVRCLLADILGVQLPSDAIRIKTISALSLPMASNPSVVVEAVVRVDLRFTRDKSGWVVTGVRGGNSDWLNPQAIFASLNEEKRKKARAELEEIARALEVFGGERGFYVSSDLHQVLINHLSPRYLSRVIRLDPWNQPYRYKGAGDHFTLVSMGPDGKENTADDILVAGSLRKSLGPKPPQLNS